MQAGFTRAQGPIETLSAPSRPGRGRLGALTIGAIGVVFGDIGTSPLYAIDEIFIGPAHVEPSAANVLGALSLVVWTLTLIVVIKYAWLVLRAENDGEGGVFALYSLVYRVRKKGGGFLLWSLMLGAGLLFGDGMITPAISVLSAVEGLDVITPAFAPYVAPITIVLLTGLFAIQSRGTSGVGAIFGPILAVWFLVIAALGVAEVWREPAIFAAFDPLHGLAFLRAAGLRQSMLIVGAVMLVVTGGEALYADLGHFGARPIRIGLFVLVYPALLANYLGQGAYLLSGAPAPYGKLFYALAPASLVAPLVALATVATIVASQALISGAFSLTSQAIGIGLLPRVDIQHTHHAHAGQIYAPAINWGLYAGCVALVLGFRSASAMAAAYGLAVAGVMLVTSIAMFVIARRYWNWGRVATTLVWGGFSVLSALFLAGSSVKIFEGGFVPLSVGLAVFVVMATWRWGRKATFAAYLARSRLTMENVVAMHRGSGRYIERNALIMSPTPVRHPTDRAPALVGLLWERYGLLPRNLILVEIVHPKVPYVHKDRYHVTVFDRSDAGGCVIGVRLQFGFMEEQNVEALLEDMARHREIDLSPDPRRWSVHVSHENLLPSRDMNMLRRMRFRLFLFLRLVSRPAYYGYGLGDAVQMSVEIMPVRVR
ncbi:MAG: KUP/HAK/KT family potassium transporter [Hyphomicrobiales bacterium]|nr:KUP/HAK/KT family potassium transporter [Hyphomicrobiales bacterium]